MQTIVAAILCGLGVGVLSGLLGVGGGMVMVPLFRLAFGMSALQTTGTSLLAIMFTSAAGSITHVRNKTCVVSLGILAGLCGATTSPFGVYAANLSPAWLVMLATAVIIAYSASTMLRKGLAIPRTTSQGFMSRIHEMREMRKHAQGEASSASAGFSPAQPPQLSRKQYAIGAVAGLLAGFAGGYVGLGGGFLMVPFFVSVIGLDMKYTSGTSLIAVAILGLSGALAQAAFGNVVLEAGLAMAAGSIPGAIIGSSFIRYIPERTLRLLFGAFLIAVAALLALNEILGLF